MKKVNYKVGDTVELADGVQYVYRGKNRKEGYYVFDPVLPGGSPMYFALSKEECVKYGYNIGAVPFGHRPEDVTVL